MDNLLEKLRRNQRRGSKPRCHWLTHGPPEQVASRLNALVAPYGSVTEVDQWMPDGFEQTDEAQLHQSPRLLSQQACRTLGEWWLAEQVDHSRTPNWDIASTFTVDGVRGLLLVEAKAHTQELRVEDQVAGSRRNREQIAGCIEEANVALAEQTGLDWTLSHQHRYQMANRFAWSWKLTELGYPVVLVYLGFLGAEEMRKGGEQHPLKNHAEWEGLVKTHSEPLFPAEVWDRQWNIRGRTIVPRICSMEVRHDAPIQDE